MKLATAKDLLENCPKLRVEIDPDGTSPSPNRAIWKGQHQCVYEGFAFDDKAPDERQAGKSVVNTLLKANKGHYSPLRWAHVVLHMNGFDHNTIMQFVRHQDSAHLVQSMRYTGKRIAAWCKQQKDRESIDGIEEIHYQRPAGFTYVDRYGQKVEYTEELRQQDLKRAAQSYFEYAEQVDLGYPFEMARGCLPTGFRQNYTLAADLQALLHILDQRTKKDAQIEAQVLADLILNQLDRWVPEIAHWYRDARYGKAILAP
ncbi:FAD-dependent thymidylate synthase [Baaleninema simplex]|uniref:FAD-dependent thymidylate synthase n=1 Tax=Baaleninema simplex TaxID=2862350 RepID=UPI00034DB87B|nr:FAD-dependent thymidylate synthase [Baaleninema simplex]